MKSNSLFDLFSLSDKEPSKTPNAPPLYLHNDQGNDFKRLLHKNRKNVKVNPEGSHIGNMKTSATIQGLVNCQQPVSTAITPGASKKMYHSSSPDFKPVILLNQTATDRGVGSGGFLSSVYNYFFQHEDRYFNQSRQELSKDIFPIGYQQQ